MDLGLALHTIWRRKLWLIPVGIASLLAALLVMYKVSFFPPALENKSLEFGAASTEVLVDSERSTLATADVPIDSLSDRATVYASLLRAGPVRRRIGEAVGAPWQAIAVEGTALSGPAGNASEPTAAERAGEIVADRDPLTVFFRVAEGQPIIQISTQARRAHQAVALADGTASAIAGYIDKLQEEQGIVGPDRIQLTQIGPATGGTVGASTNAGLGLAAALAVIAVGLLLILAVPRVVDEVRRIEALEDTQFEAGNGEVESVTDPADVGENGRGAHSVGQVSEAKR
jgi:hypothetical protein